MPLFALFISVLAYNQRNKNSETQGVDENVDNVPEGVRRGDRRIDIPVSDAYDTTSSSFGKPAKSPHRHFTRRIDSISLASVAKRLYTLPRRVLHACHKFIFEPDKALEEGYAPQHRYLPIISGLVVPFSILLEVPGLTEHWYQRQDGLQTIEYQANPIILNVGLGLSIGSALLANICLILRFLERRIPSATVAAICLLLIHDTINMTALIIFGVIHAVDDGFSYSQAYYITIASTVASLVVTTTLIIDYFCTSNFTKSGSGLTRKQRSLVIVVMILLTYLGFGALIYCLMMDIHFLDALYFCVCSTLTIGFGDISPSNTQTQVFSIFYNTFGILNTGLAIAIARETVVEAFQNSYRNRKDALSLRRKLHREAKRHAPKHGLWLATRRAFDRLFHSEGLLMASAPPTPLPLSSTKEGTSARVDQGLQPPRNSFPTLSALEEARKEEFVEEPFGAEKLEEETNNSDESPNLDNNLSTEDKEREERVKKMAVPTMTSFAEEENEYHQFRDDMMKEEGKEFRAKLLVSWGLFIVFWIFGGVIFMFSEGWSYGIAMYFCFVAFSTIGYGDYAPQTGPGRVCFIAWSLLGVGTMTILISVLSEAYQSRYSTMMHNGLFDKVIRSYQDKTHSKNMSSYPNIPTYDKETMTVIERRLALEETRARMTPISHKIIIQAKVFHAHLQYVFTHHNQEKPPSGLQRVLDEFMDEVAMNDDLRKEVLHDGDKRRKLFMVSFERTLNLMIEYAQRISGLIEERDSLKEGLGRGLDRDDDDVLYPGNDSDDIANAEGDDGFPDSPKDTHYEGSSFDTPVLKSRGASALDAFEPSAVRQESTVAHWLEAHTGLLRPKARRSTTYSNLLGLKPYLHASGSQSEPRLWRVEDEAEDKGGKESAVDTPASPKGKNVLPGKRLHRPQHGQHSKLNAVRFADNPYGDQGPINENMDNVDSA